MVNFKKNKLTLALLSASAIATSSSFAAEEAAPEKEQIEIISVSGVRLSVLSAIDAKRNSDVVGDFIGAGDLGVLPDPSIADSLGRLSGVTTVRESGQSSQLNIRGMNGDFIQTTLNGREQATTSASTESSRWMAFDQYPAELITEAAVYKTPKASHIEGGVAGTVELKTANPLKAEKEHNFTASVRGSYNDSAKDVGADEIGNKLAFTYQGKFLDDTLGFAIGYSHLTQPNSFEGSRAAADGQLGYAEGTFNGTNAQYAKAYQIQAGAGEDKRDGLLTTVVYQPNETLTVQLDYFRSEYESGDIRHGITVGGLQDLSTFNLTNTTVANGAVASGTVSLTDPNTQNDSSPWFESRTEDQSTQADSDAYGLNVQWQASERATIVFDLAHSEGKKTRKDRIVSIGAYEFGTATGLDADGNSLTQAYWQEMPGQQLTFMANGDETPTFGFNFDMTDDSLMHLSRYEEYPHVYTDEIDSAKVDFIYEFDEGFITSVELGARYSDRTFDSRRGTFLYGSRDGQFRTLDADGNWEEYCKDNMTVEAPIACMPQSVQGFTSVGSVDGAPDHLVVNMEGLADSLFGPGNYEGKQVFSNDWTFVESGAVKEEVMAVYAMANFSTEIGDIPVTGNFGVRYVDSDVKSVGVQNVGTGNGVSITDDVGVTQTNYDYVNYGPEFTDVLPSINLNFEISDNDVIRVAAAEVMARPPVGQMKGGAGSWNSGDNGDIYNVWSKGSPYLDPFRAKQIDISYEHYLEEGGAITAAVFYKSIDSLVTDISYGADDEWAGIDIPAGMTKGVYNTKENGDGGWIKGFELAVTKTFDNLPGIFSGLGINANYSYNDSETSVTGANGIRDGERLSLPGLSENIWSATVFWDIDSFSTHANIRYRSDYVFMMPIPGNVTPVIAKEYMTLDWQASYAFENGFTAILQANNLTDESNKVDYGVSSLLGEYKTFGRTFSIGVDYKF